MTDTRLTQAALEEWLTTNPRAQTTQVALEMWASLGTNPEQLLVTSVALEQWASVANVATGSVRAMVLA